MSEKNGLPTGKHTLVEEGTEFKGTMSSSCPIVVMGKVEGDVAGPVIHVTPSGVVSGVVKVKQLRSDGELAGEVEADTVEISGRGRRPPSRTPRRMPTASGGAIPAPSRRRRPDRLPIVSDRRGVATPSRRS